MNEEVGELHDFLLENIGLKGLNYVLDLTTSLIEKLSKNLECTESLIGMCMWKLLTSSLFNFTLDTESESDLLLAMMKEIYRNVKSEELNEELEIDK